MRPNDASGLLSPVRGGARVGERCRGRERGPTVDRGGAGRHPWCVRAGGCVWSAPGASAGPSTPWTLSAGRPETALCDLTRSRALLGRVGFAYEQLQDHEGASPIYEEGVELMPASLAFGARLAQAYISAGQLTDARRVLRQVREHHPEESGGGASRGTCTGRRR